VLFFFFQAEDGIRDFHVTGVQTCALPICVFTYSPEQGWQQRAAAGPLERGTGPVALRVPLQHATRLALAVDPADAWDVRDFANRSEERRVGKEGRAWRGR